MESGIYTFTNPIGQVYVGQAKNLALRFKNYYTDRIKAHRRLNKSALAYGIENHVYKIVEYCEVSDLNERERYYQDLYDVCGENGLNCKLTKTKTKIGLVIESTRKLMSEARAGKPLPESQKAIFRIIRKGAGNPMYGKTHSEETKNKFSEKRKGMFLGENHPMYGSARFGSLNPMFGKTHNADTRKKISEGLKDKPRHGKIVLNTNTGIFYDSAKEVSLLIGVNHSTIKSWLNGQRPNKSSFQYV